MDKARLISSVAQAYRWGLAGLVAAGVGSLQDLPTFNIWTYIIGIPFFLLIVVFAVGVEYILRGWVESEDND